jgi:uncharacterized protein (DUF4415 family)
MSEKEEYDFSQAKQDRATAVSPNKTRITIRLDTDILAWFRQRVHDAGGGNYQTLINDALHDHIRQQDGDLERTLRRVIREELAGRRKG